MFTFPPSLTYNVTKERAPFKKHSDESQSLFSLLSCFNPGNPDYFPSLYKPDLLMSPHHCLLPTHPQSLFPYFLISIFSGDSYLSLFLPSLNSYSSYWLDHTPSISTGTSTRHSNYTLFPASEPDATWLPLLAFIFLHFLPDQLVLSLNVMFSERFP